MDGNFGIASLLILISGVLNASFPLPMKFSRDWRFENNWLAFTTLALLAAPVGLAMMIVPEFRQIYAAASFGEFLPGIVFGFLWGTAQVTFGLSIEMVGMAMAFAIVVGMSAVIGSLTTLLVLNPEEALGSRGLILLASAVILASGLTLYARAGNRREAESGSAARSGASFRKGMAVCLYTGAMGGMINLGFAFSEGILGRAKLAGASPLVATLAVWPVVLAAGYVPNLAYTAYLLLRNRSGAVFGRSTLRGVFLAAAAAFFWLGGTLGYGLGAATMGRYGTSIGFALYMTILLLWSTILGILTREWRGASRSTLRLMRAGVAVILLSVLLLSAGGLLGS
jgi:L-rhamnose-H+ transport protein